MSAPESVSLEQLLAAARDSAAVARIREWCDRTEAAAKSPPFSFEDESVFQARMELVDEVRRLLPETTS